MEAVNLGWYDLNSTRKYPVDDNATCVGDDGTRLENNILTDCRLQYPAAAGTYVYIGGITVTPTLVTIVFVAAQTSTAVGPFVPLASVTIKQPAVQDLNYAVTALLPGVGGFVVFGEGVEVPFVGRYSSPLQSLILPKCARSYNPAPVQSIAKLNSVSLLTGDVQFLAGSDIDITVGSVFGAGSGAPGGVITQLQAGGS